MARKPKKAAAAQQNSLLGDAEASDDLLRVNLAAPAERLHESRSRKRRALVWTFIIVGVLTTANGINVMVNPPYPETEADATTSIEVNFSLGKSAAHARVAAWLAQDPSPLPGGYIVSWDGFEFLPGQEAKSDTDNPANDSELHHFTLATTAGGKTVFYDATAVVYVDATLGAYAAAEPSLLPRVPDSGQGWSSQTWPGYETAPVPDAAAAAASQWSKAFTESADALRLYVGDEDGSHSYMPLQGARVLSTTIPTAGYIKVEGEDAPSVIIARVELVIAWSTAADAKGSKVQYDIRIEGAQTASPKVVAWGPAGTGPSLKKYGNAVVGTKLGGSTDPLPTQAPEPTPGATTGTNTTGTEVVDGPGHGGVEGGDE